MVLAVAVVLAMVVGFVAGLISYRASRRWCGVCGVSLVCPTCTDLGPPTPTNRPQATTKAQRPGNER